MTAPESDGSQVFLYGPDDSEYLYFTLDEALDTWGDGDRMVYEHKTIHPLDHLPSAVMLAANVCLQVAEDGEVIEVVGEQFCDAMEDPDVLAAAERLRRAIASKITARQSTGEHTATFLPPVPALYGWKRVEL